MPEEPPSRRAPSCAVTGLLGPESTHPEGLSTPAQAPAGTVKLTPTVRPSWRSNAFTFHYDHTNTTHIHLLLLFTTLTKVRVRLDENINLATQQQTLKFM